MINFDIYLETYNTNKKKINTISTKLRPLTIIVLVHNGHSCPVQVRDEIAVRLIDVLLRRMQIHGERRGRPPRSPGRGATPATARGTTAGHGGRLGHVGGGLIVEALLDVRQMERLADRLNVGAEKRIGGTEQSLDTAAGCTGVAAVLQLSANCAQTNADGVDIWLILFLYLQVQMERKHLRSRLMTHG